jgi:NADPH2:quinone reductase
MKTMLAVQIHAYKQPDDFTPRELPIAEPRDGEVLIKVLYAGVNPSDLGNTQGYFADHTTLPRVIGRDFVGTVLSGDDQSLLGKTVMGSGGDVGFTRDGSFAQFIAVPKEGVVEVPKNVELSQAATFGVPYLAALSCLDSFPRDLSGKSILIIGGAGAVGSASTVIARGRGATVVRTILNRAEVDGLSDNLKNGDFIDLSENDDIAVKSKESTAEQGFNYVVNVVGGKTFEPGINSLTDYGHMACIASPGQPRVEFSLLNFYRRNLSLYGINTADVGIIDSAVQLRELFAEFVGKEEKLASLGETQIVPFSDARAVLEKALAKGYRKLVFKMEDS